METASPKNDVRQIDRRLLETLRRERAMTVSQLTDALGVTATAVRQRIDRMLESGLIAREKIGQGRGRPQYEYRLSDAGHREAGADAGKLAEAMWQSILALPDESVRKWLIGQIAQRLGSRFAQRLAEGSLEERMTAMSELLAEQRFLTDVSQHDSLPVLDIHACPYPDLTDEDQRRDMCQLEQEMLSEALGQPMQLSSCQLDGHSCCQFAPVGTTETKN